MRKHFLILMLMSLLPLAGWAEDISVASIAVGDITYGQAAPTKLFVVWKGETLKGTGGDAQYSWDGVFYDDAACNTVSATPLKVGVHYVKIAGVPAEGFSGEAVGSFNVNKAELTFTLKANQLDRTFGESPKALNNDATVDFNIVGLQYTETWAAVKKGSKPTYSTTSNNAGDYTTAAGKLTFTGGWTPDNYTITYAGELNIGQLDLSTSATITAWQEDVVYKGKEFTPEYTVKDKADGIVLAAGTDYTVTTATTVALSPYTPTITFQGNYTGSITVAPAKSFDVTPAPIIVSVEDVEVVYDGTDQADQYGVAVFSYSGIVGDDIANAAIIKGNFNPPSALAVDGEAINVGSYDLIIADDADTGTETNYEITGYVPATLTITKAPLAIKAKNASKGFGEKDPDFELIDYSPLVISGVTFTRAEGEDAGEYDITPDISAIVVKKSSTNVTDNYDITIDPVKGKLTIGKGMIYVTIKDAEKFYGQPDPEFKYAVTGLKGDDKLAAFDITREDNEAVGGYSLTATVVNPNPAKYEDVVVAPGILTINKAQLELSCDAFSLVKDASTAQKNAVKAAKNLVTVTGIWKDGEVATNLFDLDFDGGVVFNTDNTDADGMVATLKTAAQASYEVIGANMIDATSASFKLIVGAGTAAAQAYASIDADRADIVEHAGETQNVTINFAPRNGRELPAGTARTWKAGQWTTMVLPFDISVAELSQVLGYAIVNVINPERTKVSGTKSEFYGKLTMKGGNGSDEVLKANKPFLVKIAEDMNPATDYNFGARKLVSPKDLSVPAGAGCTFVGTYATKTVTKDDDAAIWFMVPQVASWAYIGTSSSATWDIVPFEAYIDMSGVPAAARNLVFYAEELDGSVTAIKGINSSNAAAAKQSAEGWYNLNGVKLQGAPSQKGVYIQNGKKVVIK